MKKIILNNESKPNKILRLSKGNKITEKKFLLYSFIISTILGTGIALILTGFFMIYNIFVY